MNGGCFVGYRIQIIASPKLNFMTNFLTTFQILFFIKYVLVMIFSEVVYKFQVSIKNNYYAFIATGHK